MKKRSIHLLEWLYPPRCPICDRILPAGERRCCAACEEGLPWTSGAVCMKCGKMLADKRQEYCRDCRGEQHFFDQGIAAFLYTGELRHSVYRMKAENRRDYLDFYAEAMTAALQRVLKRWSPDVIVPVPMHKSRRRERGFNQSELFAEKISQMTGIPCELQAVSCVRKHAQQKQLDRKERLKNLRGSFAARKCFSEGTRVLLVDDVYTTGSTMDELARVVKSAGAQLVFFVVLCTGKEKNSVCTAQNVCYTKWKE